MVEVKLEVWRTKTILKDSFEKQFYTKKNCRWQINFFKSYFVSITNTSIEIITNHSNSKSSKSVDTLTEKLDISRIAIYYIVHALLKDTFY